MPDVSIEQKPTLDLLSIETPSLSSTNDMPVVETKPDATNEGKPPEQKPAPEEAKVAAPDEGKKPAESAPAETPDEDAAANAEPKKPAKGVQKRIDELVKQREDAERRADAERQEKLRLLALVEKGKEDKPAAEEPLARPTRTAFASDEAYEAALDEYIEAKSAATAQREIQKTIAEQRQKAEQEAVEKGQREVQAAYKARVEKILEKYPDYHEVAESPDVQVSMPIAHAIVASEHGPDIQYYLGKNPAEAQRISALSPVQQLVELGRLVAKFETPAKAVEPPEKPKPVLSAAPKPIKPLEAGSEAQSRKSPDEESMEEYATRRQKELAAERRPGARH